MTPKRLPPSTSRWTPPSSSAGSGPPHLVSPPKQRAVFCLRYFEDVPQNEIAKTLGHTDGYISKLLQRAETRVREQMEFRENVG